ncbi:DUF58 domain-containing protein, partial [bacterium]|nr:DUF58 domain-containing protein [bacterium]
ELCTAFPQTSDSQIVRNPGAAIPATIRCKLRSMRGHLQAALDYHPQRSPNRLGLGLRPYEAGDPLRSVSLRHWLLQDQFLTRTDVSSGRFHVSIIVHSYANMNFRSAEELPTKNQLAWVVAGLLQNLHEQNAQKVDVMIVHDADLGQQMSRLAARIRRSHFCYVVSDALFNSSAIEASGRDLAAAINLLRIRRGMAIVVRDPLESPTSLQDNEIQTLAFLPPETKKILDSASTQNSQWHSGPGYVANLRIQLEDLGLRLQNVGWSVLSTQVDEEVDHLTHNLSLRMTGSRVRQ